MLRQLVINRSTTKIQLEFKQHESVLTAFIERRGDESIKASISNIGKNYEDVVDFQIDKEVHLLPYGYYDLVVMSCGCECSRYPLLIEKCKTSRPASCSESTGCSIELRSCIEKSKPHDDPKNIDLCNQKTGNEIGKSDGLNLHWTITMVDE